MKDAATSATKWKTNAGAAQQSYSDGVNNTTVDVMGNAIRQAGAAVASYTAVVAGGAWARAIQASGGTPNWKTQTVNKASHYGTGIADGATKFENAITKILADLQGIVGGLQPRGPVGSAQNYARSAAVGQALHNNKGKYKG